MIKGGILDGKPLTIAEIAKIADLESREVLLAKLAGALLASLQNAAYLFNAPLAQVARLAGALQAKARAGPVDPRAAPAPASRRRRDAAAEATADRARRREAGCREPAPTPSPAEASSRGTAADEAAADGRRCRGTADRTLPTGSRGDPGGLRPPDRPPTQVARPPDDRHPKTSNTKGTPPWRSSAPASSSTRSRR